MGDPGTPGDDGDPGRWLTEAGFALEVTSAAIDSAGVATVDFTLTDGDGTPVDADGILTEGEVSLRFILAWLDSDTTGPLAYTAYTTRMEGAEVQASRDQGGTLETLDVATGSYRYTFAASAASADRSKTHTVGIYGDREVDGVEYQVDEVFHFVPDGSPVTVTREVVETATCNGCHKRLEAHGGSRRDVELCILCHSPQSTDADTGNTVDMSIMIHKIHRGANLPSVVGGEPYRLVGFSAHDYSEVHYPREINQCTSCHTGADSDLWKNRVRRSTCGSCHDRTSFVEPVPQGWTAHPGGFYDNDGPCTICHPPTGGVSGVETKHFVGRLDPSLPTLDLTILDVTQTGPSQTPQVTFRVQIDGSGADIGATPLNTLRATIAGPTSDYADYWSATIQGSGAEGTLTAVNAAAGEFSYTFPAGKGIPANAEGSYAVGLEGRIAVGSTRVPAYAPVSYFAVTDATAVPRRQIVDGQKCNDCHRDLAFHGDIRTNPNYCVFCHNPTNTNDERISRFENDAVLAESVDFRVMIHRIHRGADLAQPYTLFGFPAPSPTNPGGSPVTFHTAFPADARRCEACHLPGTYDLPVASSLPSRIEELVCTEDPAADGDDYCDTRSSTITLIPPETAACTGCHDAASSQAHAEVMTTSTGAESCATCHSSGSAFDAALFHDVGP